MIKRRDHNIRRRRQAVRVAERALPDVTGGIIDDSSDSEDDGLLDEALEDSEDEESGDELETTATLTGALSRPTRTASLSTRTSSLPPVKTTTASIEFTPSSVTESIPAITSEFHLPVETEPIADDEIEPIDPPLETEPFVGEQPIQTFVPVTKTLTSTQWMDATSTIIMTTSQVLITSPVAQPVAEPIAETDATTSIPTTTFLPGYESAVQTSVPTVVTSSLALADQAPTVTSSPNSDGSDGPPPEDWYENPPPGTLDQTTEHLLIAAGGIGAFILFYFIGWIGYRTLKRSKGPYGLDSALPWRRRDGGEAGWVENPMYHQQGPPPMYDGSGTGTQLKSMSGSVRYMGANGNPERLYTIQGGQIVPTQNGTLSENDRSALQSILDQYTSNFYDNSNSPEQTLQSPSQQQAMLQSYFGRQDTSDRQVSGAIYGQYSQQQQQQRVSGSSRTTSLSSGFGDGGLVMPQSLKPPPAAQMQVTTKGVDEFSDDGGESLYKDRQSQSNDLAGGQGREGARFSWMSRGGRGSTVEASAQRRDTTYTYTSEDRPARFRTVSSWVNQQRGRVWRADSRARERGDIPIMPAQPGQMNYTHQTPYR